jgi:membrane protein
MPDGVHASRETITSESSLRVPEKARGVVIVNPGLVKHGFWLLRRAVVAANQDDCFSIAKGAAYSFLVALFPILTMMTSLLVHARAGDIAQVIATFIMEVVPPGTETLIRSRLLEHSGQPLPLSIVAVLVSLWAGSGAMLSLMEGFQAAYRIPSSRPFLQNRAMALFLVFIAAIPSVAASGLIIFGNRSEAAFVHWMGASPASDEVSAPIRLVWLIARYALAFCTTTFVTGLLYYFGPNHRPVLRRADGTTASRFLHVWPGAIVATFLWLIATAAFAAYVRHIANYKLFYGSLGTVVILLFWLYLIALIALIGCEFNAERERTESVPANIVRHP